MIQHLLGILSVIFILAGLFFAFAMALGMLRFPDAYTRLHAGTKGLTIGAGLIIIGAALSSPDKSLVFRMLFVAVFLLVTNPISSQAVAKASYHMDRDKRFLVVDEYEDFLKEQGREGETSDS